MSEQKCDSCGMKISGGVTIPTINGKKYACSVSCSEEIERGANDISRR